jgi:ribosomal protein S18 acetylase RimI-like enzyme
MDIVEAAAVDMEPVVALWEACGLTRPWNDPRDDFSLALNAAGCTVFVGRQDGRLLASIMVGFDGHRGWLYYLAVEPAEQRCGHGREMMSVAEAWLRMKKAPKLQLMVREANSAALAFYDNLGLERQAVVVLGKFLTDRA